MTAFTPNTYTYVFLTYIGLSLLFTILSWIPRTRTTIYNIKDRTLTTSEKTYAVIKLIIQITVYSPLIFILFIQILTWIKLERFF